MKSSLQWWGAGLPLQSSMSRASLLMPSCAQAGRIFSQWKLPIIRACMQYMYVQITASL